jgi:hypothetical protein
MAGVKEFLAMLDSDCEKAMKTFVIHIDATSLDGDGTDCSLKRIEATFDVEDDKNNVLLLRGKKTGDTDCTPIWYLPWNQVGVAKATLDQSGPDFFSTSQLDGCRFTIQYDGGRKKVTVLHISGRVDGAGKAASAARDQQEADALGAPPQLVRRYSYGKFAGTKAIAEKDNTRLFYGGNKASIFGVRDDDGAWYFFAQEIDARFGSADKALGVKGIG